MIWRPLKKAEEKKFRAWARANWKPGQEVNQLWHPVVRDEIDKMKEEAKA